MLSKDFNIYGDGFQLEVLKSLITDRDFFYQVIDRMNKDLFTNQDYKNMYLIIKKFYSENAEQPSYQQLKWFIQSKAKTTNEYGDVIDVYEMMKDETSNINDDLIVTDIALKLVKQLEVERIGKNMLNSIKDGYTNDKLLNYTSQLEGLLDYNEVVSGDFDLSKYIDSDYDGTKYTRVPTGIPELDVKMSGGLKKGTMGALIAGSGWGKSTLGVIMSCNALYLKYNVLHIFFEDTREEIGNKYYAHITGTDAREFEKPEVRKKLASQIGPDVINRLKTNLRLVQLTNGETTIENIAGLIRKYEYQENWKPDLIIIDYLSCLRTTSNETLRAEQSWQMEARLIRKIEAYAKKTETAIWLFQQTNRNGWKKETSGDGAANIQGSKVLKDASSAFLILDRAGYDYPYAKLVLDKMRGGEPTVWDNIILDGGTCQIDLSGTEELDPRLMFDNNE